MLPGLPKLIFIIVLVANCIVWSQSRYGQFAASGSGPSLSRKSYFAKRGLYEVLSVDTSESQLGLTEPGEQCSPVEIQLPADQCAHVLETCPQSDTVLSIPYIQHYYCTRPDLRPLMFAGFIFWLIFLFSTLGISAADFFCPNLGTLSSILGLDENVAGVTFLAFGNGSPDMFATFSAMRLGSGGLAIGELLGAATFVTSCVVGAMCIIKPFKVDRAPFLRDLGFFSVAVFMLLVILWDSKLEAWEAASLVVLYFIYVTVVVVGSWVERRRERRRRIEAMMRDEFRVDAPLSQYQDEPLYRDEPSPPSARASLQVPASPFTRSRAASTPGPPPRLGLEMPPRPRTRSSSPSPAVHEHTLHTPHTHLSHMPSFSLIGALEFRRVVSSLQQEASTPALSLFESPISPYPGGHYHQHHPRSPRTPSITEHQHFPWDAGLPLDDRSPRIALPTLAMEEIPEDERSGTSPIPIISHTPASPISEADTDTEVGSQQYVPLTRRQHISRVFGHIFHILFPTLHNFKSKSVVNMITAILAAPAVMALTLTLPVVVTSYNSGAYAEEKLTLTESEGRLIDFEEEGVERTLIADEEIEDDIEQLKFNKWLMAVQCALGPLFCVAILFDGVKHESWLLLAVGVAGSTVGALVAVFAKNGEHPSARLARCSMGFIVAIVWIMAIADEVVEVLQTFGLIFGLSDAIIGLTIFAVGNSSADLVANMSVAVFAPIMGFSACFGGPMLNILLGVGLSGTYIIRQTAEPYILPFSPTLLISCTGLLGLLIATMIFVSWNEYFLPRSWGVTLILAYATLMIANVIVEIKT